MSQTLADRVRHRRDELGVSRERVAVHAGVSVSTLVRIERGDNVTVESLSAVMAELGLEL